MKGGKGLQAGEEEEGHMHFTRQRGRARPLGRCVSSLLLFFIFFFISQDDVGVDSDHRGVGGHVMSLPAVDVTDNLTPPSSDGRNVTRQLPLGEQKGGRSTEMWKKHATANANDAWLSAAATGGSTEGWRRPGGREGGEVKKGELVKKEGMLLR